MCWNRLQMPKETEEPNNCKSYREFVLRNVIQKKKKSLLINIIQLLTLQLLTLFVSSQ